MENEPAPVYDCARDGEVPARFVAGCKGDRTAAAARWAATAAWRRRERIDELLDEPQPKFKHIKVPRLACFLLRTCDLSVWDADSLGSFFVKLEVGLRN
jgi:hypothetical protein